MPNTEREDDYAREAADRADHEVELATAAHRERQAWVAEALAAQLRAWVANLPVDADPEEDREAEAAQAFTQLDELVGDWSRLT